MASPPPPPPRFPPFPVAPGALSGPLPSLGEPPARTSTMLGVALLAVGVGGVVGAKVGGLFGGLAGVLYGGASVNAIRAMRSLVDGSSESDQEAAVSGTFAVLGAGVATYVLYRTRKSPREED
jgi:hypothetical protein